MFDVIVVDFRLGYYCIRYRVHALLHGNLRKGAQLASNDTRGRAQGGARRPRAQRDVGPGPTRNTALTDGALRKGQLIDSRSSRAHTVSARSRGARIKHTRVKMRSA